MAKLKITDWEKLSLRIIILFAIAMLISYSPQFLRGFFADRLYSADEIWSRGVMDTDWNWGNSTWGSHSGTCRNPIHKVLIHDTVYLNDRHK